MNSRKRGVSLFLFALVAIWTCVVAGLTAKSVPTWSEGLGDIFNQFALALPLDMSSAARAFGSHLFWLLGLAGLVLAAYGAGWPAARLVNVRFRALEGAALQMAFGWGFISLLQQGLGLTGLLFGAPIRIEMAVFFALGVRALAGGRHGRQWKEWKESKPGTGDRLPVFLVAAVMVLVFFLARFPIVQDDARGYHFAAPEHYLLIHKINFESSQMAWHMPLGLEMIHIPAWEIGGIDLASLVNLGIILTGLLLVKGVAESIAPFRGAGWWAALFFAASGVVMNTPSDARNDLMMAMMMAAAALFGIKGARGSAVGWILCGWFMGAAAGVKFTCGFMVPGLLAGVLAFGWRRLTPRLVVAGSIAALLPAAGWLVESWVFTGNPIHPFLAGWLPDIAWGPVYADAQRYYMNQFASPAARLPGYILSGTWDVLGSGHGLFAIVPLLPAAFFFLRGPAAGIIKIAVVVTYCVWLTGVRDPRFAASLVVWTAALGGSAVSYLVSSGGRAWRVYRVAVGVLAVSVAAVQGAVLLRGDGFMHLLGDSGRDEIFSRRYTTWDEVRRWVNRELPEGSRVLFTGEYRRLWFKPRVTSYGYIGEPVMWRTALDSASAEEFRKRIRQKGFTHHLHNIVTAKFWGIRRYAGRYWDERQIRVYREYVGKYCRLVYRPPRLDRLNGGFYVFEILGRSDPRGSPVLFLPETEGQFRHAIALRGAGIRDLAIEEWKKAAAGMRDVPYAQAEYAYIAAAPGEYGRCSEIMAEVEKSGFLGDASLEFQGEVLLKARRYDEALRVICRAWRIHGRDNISEPLSFAFFKRADRRLEDGRYAQAIREVEQSIHLRPGDIVPRLLAMKILVKLGRIDEARRQARSAVDLAPYDKEVAETVASVLGPLGGP